MSKRKSYRKSGIKKQVRVFLISLIIVVSLGTIAMAGYSAMIINDKTNDNPIIDFSLNDNRTDKPQESYDVDVYGSETQPLTSAEKIAEKNKRLYADAVENNENVYLVNCAESDRVIMTFAGDILLDDNYAMMSKFRARGSDIEDTFSEPLLGKMRGADIFMVNNEFPFSERGVPTLGKTFTFRANPSNINMYEQIGVDIVSLANNHAYDYGEEALFDTFSVLEAANIPYVGAGRNIDDAKKPVYFIAGGIKIAVVSATQIERNAAPDTKEATADRAGVLRCMDPSALLEVIEQAKQNSDFVVLYIHWGTESNEQTDWLQDEQAPVYAEAGVDLIIGDHPHCLQKLDMVSGVPVAYSLGNFWFNSKTQSTCLVEVAINENGMEYFKFIPCTQQDCRTRLLEGNEKEGVLNYMRGISPNVEIDSDGYVTFGEKNK